MQCLCSENWLKGMRKFEFLLGLLLALLKAIVVLQTPTGPDILHCPPCTQHKKRQNREDPSVRHTNEAATPWTYGSTCAALRPVPVPRAGASGLGHDVTEPVRAVRRHRGGRGVPTPAERRGSSSGPRPAPPPRSAGHRRR